MIDESHVTVPQIGAMYEGDMSRKRNLVDYGSGCRRPSTTGRSPGTSSSTGSGRPSTCRPRRAYELGQSQGEFVEQVIRPTGLVDPGDRQTDQGADRRPDPRDRVRTERDERVLVTTLTKKMSGI